MFTGIIEIKAKVHQLVRNRKGCRLTLSVPASWSRLPLGSSVAVDGCCLTVCARSAKRLSFDLLTETLKRTYFSALKAGDVVNLERAVKAGRRMEGHFVQGHVDAVGRVRSIRHAKKESALSIDCPPQLKPYLAAKGSIAVNGVSLTLGKTGRSGFTVHLVPFTLQKTNLGSLEAGSPVNLEADILLKFFHRLTRSRAKYKLITSKSTVRKWYEKI